MSKQQVIAVDGPSGSGKSTISKIVAKNLDIIYIDTGSMFRSLGLYFLNTDIDFSKDELSSQDHSLMDKMMSDLKFEYGVDENILVRVNGEDWTKKIREHHVSKLASDISKHGVIREYLKKMQRDIVTSRWAILDGRDIGTVIFPEAALKIYLTASAEVRGQRRYDELISKGESVELADIVADIKSRDYQDMNREIAPLKQADDAVLVDSSEITIEQVVDSIMNEYKKVR